MRASSEKIIVKVMAGQNSYPVIIGRGLGDDLNKLVRRSASNGRIFVVVDAGFYTLHGRGLEKSFSRSRLQTILTVIPSGERYKTTVTVDKLQNVFLAQRISRADFVLAVGGGVTSDIVGYAASTVLRGVPWGICATTLLSMVDAAVGGKTGVNHKLGKNLIGTFWQPSFVVDDLEWLTTLDSRQLFAGMGEIVKTAGLVGGSLLADTIDVLKRWEALDLHELSAIISQAVAFKANIVGQDERDTSLRLQLNYGHTFAHAIERSLQYRHLLHGEAVLIGILGALQLADNLGLSDTTELAQYRTLVQECLLRLPRRSFLVREILTAMDVDKKRVGTRPKFVLLKRPGQSVIIENPPAGQIRKAVESMIKQYGGRDRESHTRR